MFCRKVRFDGLPTYSYNFYQFEESRWKLVSYKGLVWDIKGAVHQEATILSEGSSLFGFRVHINPHFASWFVCDLNVPLRNFISDEEILRTNVFCAFRARELAVYLEKNGTFAVLVH